MENNTYFLKIDDLVSNLFIILMENGYDVKSITYPQIEKFGLLLKQEGLRKGINIFVRLGRDDIQKFLSTYSDVFEENESDEERVITLGEGITPVHLIWYFRGHYSLELFNLVSCDEVMEKGLEILGLSLQEKVDINNIDFYLTDLYKQIDECSETWDFEKCILLRERYNSLKAIQDEMNGHSLPDDEKSSARIRCARPYEGE